MYVRPAGQVQLPIVGAQPAETATAVPADASPLPPAPAPVAVVPTPDTASPDPVEDGTFCPSLPSSETANAVLNGEPDSIVLLGRDLAVRGALVTVGVALVDRFVYHETDLKRSFARGLAGATGIEVFVLGWMMFKRWHHRHLANGTIVTPGNPPVL